MSVEHLLVMNKRQENMSSKDEEELAEVSRMVGEIADQIEREDDAKPKPDVKKVLSDVSADRETSQDDQGLLFSQESEEAAKPIAVNFSLGVAVKGSTDAPEQATEITPVSIENVSDAAAEDDPEEPANTKAESIDTTKDEEDEFESLISQFAESELFPDQLTEDASVQDEAADAEAKQEQPEQEDVPLEKLVLSDSPEAQAKPEGANEPETSRAESVAESQESPLKKFFSRIFAATTPSEPKEQVEAQQDSVEDKPEETSSQQVIEQAEPEDSRLEEVSIIATDQESILLAEDASQEKLELAASKGMDFSDIVDSPLQWQQSGDRFIQFADGLIFSVNPQQYADSLNGDNAQQSVDDTMAEMRSSAANSNILLCYAEALRDEKRHKTAEAIARLEQLGRPALDDPTLCYELARLKDETGQDQAALAQYRQVLNLTDDEDYKRHIFTRIISILAKSDDFSGIIRTVRMQLDILDEAEQTEVLMRCYGLLSKLDVREDRRWLVSALLDRPEVGYRAGLMRESYHLAVEEGDNEQVQYWISTILAEVSSDEALPWSRLALEYARKGEDFIAQEERLRSMLEICSDVEAISCWKSLAEVGKKSENTDLQLESLRQLADCDSSKNAAQYWEKIYAISVESDDHYLKLEAIRELITIGDDAQRNQFIQVLSDLAETRGSLDLKLEALEYLAQDSDGTERIDFLRKHWVLLKSAGSEEQKHEAIEALLPQADQQERLDLLSARWDLIGSGSDLALKEATLLGLIEDPAQEARYLWTQKLVDVYAQKPDDVQEEVYREKLITLAVDLQEEAFVREQLRVLIERHQRPEDYERLIDFASGDEQIDALLKVIDYRHGAGDCAVLPHLQMLVVCTLDDDQVVEVSKRLQQVSEADYLDEKTRGDLLDVMISFQGSYAAQLEPKMLLFFYDQQLARLESADNPIALLSSGITALHFAEKLEVGDREERLSHLKNWAGRMPAESLYELDRVLFERLLVLFPDWTYLSAQLIDKRFTEALSQTDHEEIVKIWQEAQQDLSSWTQLLTISFEDLVLSLRDYCLNQDFAPALIERLMAEPWLSSAQQFVVINTLASELEKREKTQSSAISLWLHLLDYAEAQNDLVLATQTRIRLMVLYKKSGDTDKVTELQDVVVTLPEAYDVKVGLGMIRILETQGLCAFKKGERNGEAILLRAWALRQNMQQLDLGAVILLGNLGEIFFKDQKFVQAQEYFNKAIALYKDSVPVDKQTSQYTQLINACRAKLRTIEPYLELERLKGVTRK